MKLFISGLALLIGISSCSWAPARRDIPDLSPEQRAQLIRESEPILEKFTGITYDIPAEEWPDSISRLEPVEVRRYNEGLGVLLWKWVSKEDGIMITNPGYVPENSTGATYKRIADRLYWYEIRA
jgi:hypothetical protein